MHMKIGVPKEIKNNESRVGMTPAGVYELAKMAIRYIYNRLLVREAGFLMRTTKMQEALF